MSVARTRAFTLANAMIPIPTTTVEMSVARTRAFTHSSLLMVLIKTYQSRNECCPYEGIYTVRTFKLTTVSAG